MGEKTAMRNKIVIVALMPVYLAIMGYFALRPFQIIPGAGYARASLEWSNGAVHLQRDAALEDRRNASRVRRALMATGRMSLAVSLQTDSLDPGVPARIVSYSRNRTHSNFSLNQEDSGLSFRLLTAEADNHSVLSSLFVPHVFETNRVQQLVVTYDGLKIRLFVDGEHCEVSVDSKGSFANWGRDEILVIGDGPAGGVPWSGRLHYLAIYNRALEPAEVARLYRGLPPPDAILVHDFKEMKNLADAKRKGLKPLRYRNLFILTDSYAFYPADCLFNIVGFLPLGVFVYMGLPLRIERRKVVAVILAPLLAGCVVSGTIEYMQHVVAGRVPCALDLLYNAVGTLMGSLLSWLAFSTFDNRICGKGRR